LTVAKKAKTKAARYRAEAQRAVELAGRAETPDAKWQLVEIARSYWRLADERDPPSN
jgi:hypothetical protein